MNGMCTEPAAFFGHRGINGGARALIQGGLGNKPLYFAFLSVKERRHKLNGRFYAKSSHPLTAILLVAIWVCTVRRQHFLQRDCIGVTRGL